MIFIPKTVRCILTLLTLFIAIRFAPFSVTGFHICESEAPKLGGVLPICKSKDKSHHLICFGGIGEEWSFGLRSKYLRILTLCEWPDINFDPETLLRNFPSLKSLSLFNGSITNILRPFPIEAQNVEKLVIIGTRLRHLSDGILRNLSALQILDLRYNSFSEINPENFNSTSLQTVYLFGNPWKCRREMAWILESGMDYLSNKIIDKADLRCSVPYEGRPLIPVVEIIVVLGDECQRTVCECQLAYVYGRVDRLIQKQLKAFVSVNCSNRGLTEMPSFLPANTTVLQLSENKITDLSPLATNAVYRFVQDLYLDHNLVESISLLDGTHWLENFRLLNLRNNKLTDLPTYALEHALPQNINSARLYLGHNPWRCDCLFTPGFQDFLIRYANLVKDINDIRCSAVEADEIANKQIRELTRTEICISPEEDYWLLPLDVLNATLAFLIFLVLGKLLYDYLCFKRTGKLPWIVTKIP
ncbi:protein singed wings 2 [Belonocnema kinseyi]|uniref:protein singed wings 2 n=1 Tax=Belonocnema kinseyi TaxID=2817044 RepID=UPI00143D7292|nr:protein singed wings 2 [Belonocnema kinseyi]